MVSLSVSQSVSSPPHRVYGQITDASTPVHDLNTSFRADSAIIASGVTDSSGFYDLYIRNSTPVDLDSGEDVYLFVNGSNTSKYVNFSVGSSQRVDHAGDYIDDSGQQDQQDGTGDDDGTNGGGGGGGSGGGSVGEGGSFFPEPDDEEEAEPKEFSVNLGYSDSVELDVGDLVEGQSVSVSVTGGSSLTGLSFTSGEEAEEVSLNLSSLGERPEGTASLGVEPYGFYFLGVENLSSYEDAVLGFEVSRNWLSSRNVSRNEVMLKYFDGGDWSDLDASSTGETLNSYVFEADTAVQGYFASAVPRKEEEAGPDVEVTGFDVVTEGERTVAVKVTAEVVNRGEGGEGTVVLLRDGNVAERETVDLAAGETGTVRFGLTLEEPGNHTIQVGSHTREIQVASGPEWGLWIFAGAGGFILLVLASIFTYIYISETRRARELEDKIRNFEENTGRFGQGMQNVRENVGAQNQRRQSQNRNGRRQQGRNRNQGQNQRKDREDSGRR